MTLGAFGNMNYITFYTKEGKKLHFPNFLVNPKVYLQHSQASKVKPFVKIVHGCYPWTIFAKKLLLDLLLGSKYPSDAFIKYIAVYGMLYVTLDFHVSPKIMPYLIERMCFFIVYPLFAIFLQI